MMGKHTGLLEGVRVLDLAMEPLGLCSTLLAELGARVIRIANSQIHPSGSAAPCNAKTERNPLRIRDRQGAPALRRWIQTSDVLLESFPPGYLKGLGLRQLQKLNPRLIHISISGFGHTGPRKHYHGSNAVFAAFGGQMYVTGGRSGVPTRLSGPQSYNAASLFAANAAVLNLRRRRHTGKGGHIDLSIQEAVVSTLDHILIDYFHDGTIARRQGDEYPQDPFPILRCKDGFIQIPILRNWDTINELMAAEGYPATSPKYGKQGTDCSETDCGFPASAVQRWTRNHSRRELFELGQSLGFPWAPITSREEMTQSPQLRARGFFSRAASLLAKKTLFPGLPCKLCSSRTKRNLPPEPGKTPGPSAGSGDILRGIRVLDLTRMVAGPCATRILGDFGAEVIKVQSIRSASGAERNDSPAFLAWNRNKRSIGLNLDKPEAQELFLELVSRSDIVVENFSPRVLANWGLTYKRLKIQKPDLIMASISAMGHSGPWKNRIGFAPTFHALSGLTAATSRPLDVPEGIGFAFGDVITGLYASLAILTSLENRDRTGAGHYLDLSAYEAVCTLMDPESDDCENAAPCGCYPCRGTDRWCTLAVTGEEAWQAFCQILNRAELSAARFSTLARRRKHKADLDALIAQWSSRRCAETIVRRLQRAGIAAGVVCNAEDLARDRQLAARNFFLRLPHPILGDRIVDRSALWPRNEKTSRWKAAPQLGEANHYVFVEWLGHSEREFRDFSRRGIIEAAHQV